MPPYKNSTPLHPSTLSLVMMTPNPSSAPIEAHQRCITIGVIARNRYADIIFAFNAQDFTLEHGIEEINYLIIALEGTVRCSSDFDSNKLLPLLEDI